MLRLTSDSEEAPVTLTTKLGIRERSWSTSRSASALARSCTATSPELGRREASMKRSRASISRPCLASARPDQSANEGTFNIR